MNTHSTSRRSGFSLVEVLAAMAVLSVIVLIVARLFADSSNAWDAGTRRMDNNLIGRSALEFIAREMSQSIADEDISMAVQEETGPTGWITPRSDRLHFVGLNSRAESRSGETYRDIQQITYGLSTTDKAIPGITVMRLMRGVTEKENAPSFVSYHERDNWWARAPSWAEMSLHVIDFRVNVFTNKDAYVRNFNSRIHGPPLYADVMISVLSERDSVRAAGMSGNDRTNYINKTARRYTTRVYFHNNYRTIP